METINILDLAFVTGGAGASTGFKLPQLQLPALPKFNTGSPQLDTALGTIGDAAKGCATGAVGGIAAGPHGAILGCAVGAGSSLIGDIFKGFGSSASTAAKK